MDQSEIRSLFIQALEVPAEQREAFLASATTSAELRQAVITLLGYDAGAETFLHGSILANECIPQWTGQRFGVYELQELLGRGGMGAVFKAARIDGELEQVVAIKIAERIWLDPHAIERFRRERQILAGLSHPNIARLLGGGTRDDGVLYLVMEYVDGQRLDRYCASRHQTISEMLRVFLPLCSAVEYAHRNLVIHRDLKPSNILVTAGGEPKLLDFGIAKVLDADKSSATQTLILTPDFASPEQARGEPLTTATDVYGLGAVLYHLLTGNPPHATGGAPLQVAQAVAEGEVTSPSLHRRELHGDLENILLKALHRDPARRYGSAEAFGADLNRYLERRPVRATADSWGYRARRFAGRNRMAVTAGTFALVAILAGSITSLYEAHRAQQRFGQVRSLAGRFIFDFEESIRELPGTLEARRTVASTAREYLENLKADARGDAGLKRELADSYYRLSLVEKAANESDAALRDLNAALGLWRETKNDCCGTPHDRSRYITALIDWTGMHRDARDMKTARTGADESLRLARQWFEASPLEPLAQRALLHALLTEQDVAQRQGDIAQARAALRELAERYNKMQPHDEADDDFAKDQALAANTIAFYLLDYKHDAQEARDAADRSVQILNRLIEKHPNNALIRNWRVRATSLGMRAVASLAEKDPALTPQVLERARAAFQLASVEAQRDPRDTDLADLEIIMGRRLALQLKRADKLDEAAELLRGALNGIDRLMKADPKNLRYPYLRGETELELGQVLLDAADWRSAEAALLDAERYTNEATIKNPDDARLKDDQVGILAARARLAQRLGDPAKAREQCRAGFRVALEMIHKDPSISVSSLPVLRRLAVGLGIEDPTGSGVSLAARKQ